MLVRADLQVSWLDVYLCNDVDTAVELLSSKITFILDTMAPLKTIQIRTRYAPWLSKYTASETKNREDWIKFKMLWNKINNFLLLGGNDPNQFISCLKLYDYSIKGLLGLIILWSCLVSCPSDKESLPSLTTQLRVRSATP